MNKIALDCTASIVYQINKIILSLNALPKNMAEGIVSDKILSDEQRAEKYFSYEVKKAPRFDKTFEFDVSNRIILEIGSNVGGYIHHLLNRGAKFVYGIEIDNIRYSQSIRLLKKFHNENQFKIFKADSRKMSMIKSESIDIIVSDATLEHIKDIAKLFQEISRVLKAGGHAYLATSPIWRTWNGGHIIRYIPVPWVHLFLPDLIILKVLEKQYKNGDFSERASKNVIGLYQTIGKLTIKELKKAVKIKEDLELVNFKNISNSKIKRTLMKFSPLEEFFSGNICLELKKDPVEKSLPVKKAEAGRSWTA